MPRATDLDLDAEIADAVCDADAAYFRRHLGTTLLWRDYVRGEGGFYDPRGFLPTHVRVEQPLQHRRTRTFFYSR